MCGDEITIDLSRYERIEEKSSYNKNYYRLKEGGWINAIKEVYMQCDEDENTSRFYSVCADGSLEFLFCDYCYNENKDDHDVYSGILGDWWS